MKAKTSDEAAHFLEIWMDENGFLRVLACDNGTEFKGAVKALCKSRGTKVVNGRAYHPQSQGSIEVANKIFKARLRAAQKDTGIKEWVQLLLIIAWVINTTRPETLPRGITPFQVWFGRDPPKWQKLATLPDIRADKGTPFISHASDGEEDETEEEEEGEDEDALFVEEGEQEEEAGEGLILSELSQRVAEYTVEVQARMVKKKGADSLEYALQETATLAIPLKLRFSLEVGRILVRILEKLPKVCLFTLFTLFFTC